ncbi:hypothetical protein HMPREF3201_02008 [Megasphaera sp. MJR8396C]|nr:hypothetical protein HMPREF3201_02008 [Megasphaera sp. MJR8396C]
MIVEITAIGTEVDAGQDDFLKTGVDETFGFGNNGIGTARLQSAAGIGNDAVGTEIIAAFLYLQVCPRMFNSRRIEGDFLKFIVTAHVVDGRKGFITAACNQLADDGDDAFSFIGPDDGIDFGHRRKQLRIELGITAGNDDLSRFIALLGPPDELARLFFTDLGDRTGIDDVDVGRAVKISFFKASL